VSGYYVLQGHDAVPVDDVREWARRFNDSEGRRVASTTVGEATVSTVFLGLDHRWGEGRPLLFETMIFGGDHTEVEWRWATWDEAEVGHRAVVAALKAGTDPMADAP